MQQLRLPPPPPPPPPPSNRGNPSSPSASLAQSSVSFPENSALLQNDYMSPNPPVSHSSIGTESGLSFEAQPDEGALFLGESATLRCVYDDEKEQNKHPSPEDNARLQFSLPKGIAADAGLSVWEAERKERRIRFLRDEGAFAMPSSALCQILLTKYVEWFDPCFPLIDRVEVLQRYEAGTLSPLLSLAIFSVAAAHCDDETFANAGLVSRQRARYLFYNSAKDLYDADYETDKTTVIQAAFLLSFWRSGRLLDKHTRHWLGIAITLAQSNAMHRCFPNQTPNLEPMRRRIWWSIYVREHQCCAALGLPSRIRDEDCDIEKLEADDLDESLTPLSPLARQILPPRTAAQRLYAPEMVKLASLLRRIIDAEYIPRRTLDAEMRHGLRAELDAWEGQLPVPITTQMRLGDDLNLQGAMLHIAYNNMLILLFRNTYIHTRHKSAAEEADIVVQAASRNSRVVEDLLSRNLMRHTDIHLINGLFNTLCVHVVHLRRSQGTVRAVTEHRARLCLLALREVQKTWQVTVWLLQLRLFFEALDHPTIRRLQLDDPEGLNGADEHLDTMLPPAFSIQPDVWRLNPQGDDVESLLDFSTMNASLDADMAGLFDWPLGSEENGHLNAQAVQMDSGPISSQRLP